MNIAEYLESESITQAEFALMVGVSQGSVSHWVVGRKQVSPRRAAIIEQKTSGKVSIKDLCPYLFENAA